MKKKYGEWTDPNNEYVKKIPYWDLFKNKYSKSSIKSIFLTLVDYLLFLEERFQKTLLMANGIEILTYFQEVINAKEISKSSKNRYRYFISSYYNYVKNFKNKLEQEEFTNPVPTKDIYDFDGKTNALYDLQHDFELLTMKDIKRILAQLYYVKPNWVYTAGSLIIYSGARVREIAQIKLANLDIENRWFLTEVKSNKSEKRMGMYFFPEFFQEDLERYIKLLNLRDPECKYLFPSKWKSSSSGYISKRTIQRYMQEVRKELGIKALTNPHAYRDFINSRREEKGATKTQLKFLLMQKIPDVNTNHYLKKYKNRRVLRDIYDKFDPFEENIKPKPKL